VAQWLRCCVTNRKVAGSIPDGVIGIFHWHNPFDRTVALGPTKPLTEMSTRSISWGWKRPVRKADNLTTILGHCHVIWEPKLPGTLWAPRACNETDLPIYMFRTAMFPLSLELIISIRHLIYVTLCRWPSGMQVWMEIHGVPSKQSDIYQMSYWYN